MQPPPGQEFVEVARARDEIEAIVVSRMLSRMGIRVAGGQRSIMVPRAQYSRALGMLQGSNLLLNAANEAIAFSSDRARVEEWASELRGWRLPSFTAESEQDGRMLFTLEVAVPDAGRARDLLRTRGLAQSSELAEPGDARPGRGGSDRMPAIAARRQVEMVSKAAIYVIVALFAFGALIGLLGAIVR